MPTSPFDTFCHQVCSFVRFWPDHAAITAELTAHLEDCRDALLERNTALSPEEAVARAKEYLAGALAAMLDLGHGRGTMCHLFDREIPWV